MTSLPIITTEERLKEQRGLTVVIFGATGIGKTSLLKTLKEPTLCLDMEAGLLAAQDWKGDSLKVRDWDMARDLACLIGGVNPATKALGSSQRMSSAYTQEHFERACHIYGSPSQFDKYTCLFIDSLTVASRLCLQWCKAQPEARSEKTNKPDIRAAYGLLASEMMSWLNQFQHLKHKDTLFVGILEQRVDEFHVSSWVPQIEGSKTALELPGVVDEVFTLIGQWREINDEASKPVQVFKRLLICKPGTPYPAKDRSGRLEIQEEADLSVILAKIKGPLPLSASSSLPSSPPLASPFESIDPITGECLIIPSSSPLQSRVTGDPLPGEGMPGVSTLIQETVS